MYSIIPCMHAQGVYSIANVIGFSPLVIHGHLPARKSPDSEIYLCDVVLIILLFKSGVLS